jgi:Flp pilus assembly protein TadG
MRLRTREFEIVPRLRRLPRRSGKILVLVAIMLPTLCGLIGLVVDGGLLLSASREAQHAADSAATAAAIEKQHGQSNATALAVATQFVQQHNVLSNANVSLNSPPTSGPYTGLSGYVEVSVTDQYSTYFIHILGGPTINQIAVRSVAGFEPSTVGAAIIVLDPDPPPFDVSPLPAIPVLGALPSLPAIVGGLEVLGVGAVEANGAVLVNTTWGGLDENGTQVGDPHGPQGLSHAVSATPILGTSSLKARDIRVVGGVDDPTYYGPLVSDDPQPLKAGKLPVDDPYKDLPAPTLATDAANVKATVYGGKTVLGLPLIGPPVTLQPGVYDWIEVISGQAIFQPGIYIVRGKNPVTQLALSVVAGQVQANGVMFYITDTVNYSPASGLPDAIDGQSNAPLPGSSNTPPCAVINIGLLSSTYRGLSDSGSPFDGLFIYQRRFDRRPIILVQENLIGPGQLRGTMYSKWGHVILAGKGTYDARFVVGTMRLIALLDMQIRPSILLPPAEDVYLVE